MNISEYKNININSTTQTSQNDSTGQVDQSDSKESFKDFLKEQTSESSNKNEESNTQTSTYGNSKSEKALAKKKSDEKNEENDKSAEMNVIHMNLAKTNAELLNITKSRLSSKTSKSKNMESFRLDVSQMNKNDVEFLKQIVDRKDIAFNSISSDKNQIEIKTTEDGVGKVYKTLDISKGVFEVVDKAYNTQKPVRLDFDGNSSVILKIDKEGKLSAEFMSSDKVMSQALQENLPTLRNRLDAQNLPYKEISYRNQSREQNNQNNQNNNKNKNNGG